MCVEQHRAKFERQKERMMIKQCATSSNQYTHAITLWLHEATCIRGNPEHSMTFGIYCSFFLRVNKVFGRCAKSSRATTLANRQSLISFVNHRPFAVCSFNIPLNLCTDYEHWWSLLTILDKFITLGPHAAETG